MHRSEDGAIAHHKLNVLHALIRPFNRGHVEEHEDNPGDSQDYKQNPSDGPQPESREEAQALLCNVSREDVEQKIPDH